MRAWGHTRRLLAGSRTAALECATAIGRPSFMGIANGGRRPYAEGYTRTSARLNVTGGDVLRSRTRTLLKSVDPSA
jgi:hypothetical protein